MKKIIYLTVFLFVSITAYCLFVKTKSEVKFKVSIPPLTSLLDSIQGKWISIDDTLNQMTISNKKVFEDYLDEDSSQNKRTYDIYFSDTMVDVLNTDISTLMLDDTKLSGEYLITMNLSKNELWCYKINGFSIDSATSKFIFSISDTWAKKRPIAYLQK